MTGKMPVAPVSEEQGTWEPLSDGPPNSQLPITPVVESCKEISTAAACNLLGLLPAFLLIFLLIPTSHPGVDALHS